MIFRDVHELFRVGLLEEMLTGVVNGTEITTSLMLVAGIGLEISILMVILARVLPYRANRWANIIISFITMLSLVSAGTNDMDDIFFLAVELMALGYIIYYAWTWHGKMGTTEQKMYISKVEMFEKIKISVDWQGVYTSSNKN